MLSLWMKITRPEGLQIQKCRLQQLWKTRTYFAPVCWSSKKHTNLTRANRQGRPGSQRASQTYIAPADQDSTGDEESLSIHTVGGEQLRFPWSLMTRLSLWNRTGGPGGGGAAVTIVSEKRFRENFDNSPLRKSELLLTTYSGDRLTVLDTMDGVVQYEQQRHELATTDCCPKRRPILTWQGLHGFNNHPELEENQCCE